ncbi:hypothetical protein PFICI_05737 [Pestalotiopsis fici W106-1]|uniref:P-loop containing nucleoside triphosphate hydrolase protein n=1 Tax=Pestalotiopsis fici (strain W106-1 / CGMCC3.15140) TaxID=1229662 RepID=W3XF86_PESFW|nr:uncharacterized protein PFICI_05737 [Pestalotiopsis fici W106-1]ETS83861.1 hypothetical protein PFICI_05737 [Pestalotiopsis fici W106-1]
MWPSITDLSAGWQEQLCLPDHDSAPLRGHLSDDQQVEAILQGLLQFGPAAWLLIGASFRIAQLRGAPLVVLPNRQGYPKALVVSILCALQLSYLLLSDVERSQSHLLAARLSSVASAVLCVLSFLEHGRSVQPSTLLTSYLLVATLSDAINAGLLFVARNLCSSEDLTLAIFATRFALLILEGRTKTSILREPYDELSPEETSGFFGVAFYWWVNKILRNGYSRVLSLDDMPAFGKSLDVGRTRDAMQREWDTIKKQKGRFSLVLAQLKCSWWSNIDIFVPRFIYIVLRCCQPLLISRVITSVSSSLTSFDNRNEALRLILLAFVIYTGMAICNGMYERRIAQLNCQIRMGLVGVIYNRCLTIETGVLDDSAAVTLMSSDTEDAANAGELFHQLWSEVLELCIGMYMLARELGWVCISPLLVVLCTSKAVNFITENLVDRQIAFSQATQMRISTTKAILDAMKNIKIMGLGKKMEGKIQATRVHEMKQLVAFHHLLVAFFVSAVALSLFSPAITLIIYAIQSQLRGVKSIDVEMVFTSLAIIDIVTTPANTLLSILGEAASVIAAFDRIQSYLLSPDREDRREFLDTQCPDHDSESNEGSAASVSLDQVAIRLDNVTVRPASTAAPVLRNISTVIKKGSLVVISGAVGTGKSSLAKTLLGDLTPDAGVIQTAYLSIAYCSQAAWLTNGTIREAICGPIGDDTVPVEEWYKRVVHACGLEEDFSQLPDGDQTVIGSRGITLSGGQKQRVALARSVYARRSLVILDDVLSALDAKTARHIVENLIGPNGLFKELGTTVVLITHATQHLSLADHFIILGDRGQIAKQGSRENLRVEAGYSGKTTLGRDEKVDGTKHENQVGNREKGRDESQAPPKQRQSSMQDIVLKTGDTTLYGYYFGAIGLSRLLLLSGALTLYATFSGVIPYWLRWMAENRGDNMWLFTSVYFALALGAFLSLVTAVSSVFFVIAPHSGNTLHARLLRTVMHAKQSYFSETDTGTTLTRFGADMALLNRQLPFALFQVLQSIFSVLSQCILVGLIQPFITATLPFTIFAVYLIQKVYLATSRQMRFLDLEARALVNASFLETLEGVATIRAFGWQESFIRDNAMKLDLSLRPDYLLLCIQRWLGLVLDLIVPGLAVSVIGLAFALKGSTTGGQIGIALNVVLRANHSLLRLVEAWTKLETSLGSISRLRAFEQDVQPEDEPGTTKSLPPSWPARGAIELTKVSASYRPAVLALNDISIDIAPGTKVGVVGRTGGGKSSLLLSLLRLIELEGQGTICIDGSNICDFSRDDVRARLIVVPQDPMFIATDTVRENLDIAGANISDDDIVHALERVGLWDPLQARKLDNDKKLLSTERHDSNDSEEEFSESGDDSTVETLDRTMRSLPLSHGQQQMFSLARALLMRPYRGRVVLLDEATSNVDGKTDQLMQTLVREEFKEHTVITVAHRLDTIMDKDVVLVMDAGKLVEAGRPSELVERVDGLFRELIRGKNR